VPSALLVDDNANTVSALAELVRAEGFTVSTATTIDKARSELLRQVPDVVLLDLNLPDGSGLSLLDAVNGRSPAFVLITGHASVDTAVEALRRGVTDYLTKPLDVTRLREILSNVARTSQLPQEIHKLESELDTSGRFGSLIVRSPSMRRVCELIGRIAPSSASVLITGESGTGKDVVARTIHELSRRRHGPFVAVNCGAIPATLMESELFGHERGSFTGAERRHRGVFERAHRGTLFLDEITEMPTELQVKLLRVLESDGLARVGGEEQISVDVRILASSNRKVLEAIERGTFRQDLYYRLRVFELGLAPLRERPEDVSEMALRFLDDLAKESDTRKTFTPEALQLLAGYSWPGNVRELRNVVHSASILAGAEIGVDHLPSELRGAPGASNVSHPQDDRVLRVAVGTSLADVERQLIEATLRSCSGNKTRTAEILGISLKTLYNRLNAYQDAGSQSWTASSHTTTDDV
jgi:DNA-binding NtrC family response regulator